MEWNKGIPPAGLQKIHDWSSIKYTDYSSPVLWECHHQANMAARLNIRHVQDWQITVLYPKRFIEIITVRKDVP